MCVISSFAHLKQLYVEVFLYVLEQWAFHTTQLMYDSGGAITERYLDCLPITGTVEEMNDTYNDTYIHLFIH